MTAFLKAEKLLVVLALNPNLFQSFAPLHKKLFCLKDVFNSGRFKSTWELHNFLTHLLEILVNGPCISYIQVLHCAKTCEQPLLFQTQSFVEYLTSQVVQLLVMRRRHRDYL